MIHRLFISYSRKDAVFAAQLAADLRQHGADVWIDVREIQAGTKWSSAIQDGLDEATIMLLILTPHAMASKNVEDEWQYFVDEKKPIIPILLELAKVHFQLKRIQYVDFYNQPYNAAFKALRHELGNMGLSLATHAEPISPHTPPFIVPPVPLPEFIPGPVPDAPTVAVKTARVSASKSPVAPLPAIAAALKSKLSVPRMDWIKIPKGEVTLERNAGTFVIAPFFIAKYPVTNAQFQAFIDDGGYREDRYWNDLAKRETTPLRSESINPTHPRDMVNWYEAVAFCRWLSEKSALTVTLPTEMQWQWAAAGNKGWAYPYGGAFDKSKANTAEGGIGKTTPVDRYAQGASPFGVLDMSGNVWEWCLNEYLNVAANEITNNHWRALRGGAFDLDQDFARTAYRHNRDPEVRHAGIGFRVAQLITPR